MRQAVERAQRAEAAASEAGGNDEALRKTLVLAQRTADLAVQEAREQAARILAGAEQQAQAMLADAEERGRRTMEDATAESRSELARLETARAQAQQDVDTLNRWLEEHKAHLLESLTEATPAVERAGVLWPPPPPGRSTSGGLAAAQPSAPEPRLRPRPNPAGRRMRRPPCGRRLGRRHAARQTHRAGRPGPAALAGRPPPAAARRRGPGARNGAAPASPRRPRP